MDYYIAITPSSWPRPWEVFRNPINLVIIAVIIYTIVKTLSEASKIYAGLIILETSVKFSMQFPSSQRLGEACRVIVQLSGSEIVGMRSEGAGGSKVRPGVRLMSSHHAITPPQHTQTGLLASIPHLRDFPNQFFMLPLRRVIWNSQRHQIGMMLIFQTPILTASINKYTPVKIRRDESLRVEPNPRTNVQCREKQRHKTWNW